MISTMPYIYEIMLIKKAMLTYANIVDKDDEAKGELADYIGYTGQSYKTTNNGKTEYTTTDGMVRAYRDAILPVMNSSMNSISVPSGRAVSFVKSSRSMGLGIDTLVADENGVGFTYPLVDDVASILGTMVAVSDIDTRK